ncbi:MAG: LytTR family DNA-binding domain-containing protein [Defluviitaleaceae bacterium]|nr:LytTR family DNA-binding domain-containing protein [Defluviitaleaceae bacterium]
MVNIAVCDDEIKVCESLEQFLTEIFDKLNIPLRLDIFHSGKTLCDKIEAEEHYDLVFLDIEFANDEISGVDVGQTIRNAYNNNSMQIVYISWEKGYSMQLFQIRPLDFLLKPLEFFEVEETIKTYLRITGLNSGVLAYKKGHDNFEIRIKDIVYLENSKRKVIIHLANGTNEEFYGSLKDVYNEQLKEFDFLFTHASFAVNYDYITVVKHNQLLVTDALIPIPIAPNKKLYVKKKYLSIIRRRRLV